MSVLGAIGLDLGSQTACLTVAKKGGVEIVINEANYRETQLVVGFGDNERFIGEQGYVQLKSNFKNSIVYPTRFLGLRADSPQLAEEKKWLYTPLTTVEGDRVAFEVRYKGEKRAFQPEQVVAMLLQKLVASYKKIGVGHNDMVISVPSYFTESERKALMDAAKIAGINVVRLFNESTANVLSYGIFRKNELTTEPKNVCFVDLGHSKTSVYVASFTQAEGKILNQVHERNLGTRDMDWKLWEHCAGVFNEQHGIGIKNNAKARLRILDALEKGRKTLSANIETGVNVDCVAEDCDLNLSITREKFEELITPVVEKFRAVLEKLKAEIKVPIQSVEIIGGGTRIPIIQRVIQEVLGHEVSRTLNGTENCARGCGIQAAMLSPLFKVAEYKIEEANYYPIRCSWLFQNSEEAGMNVESDQKNIPEKQTSILFDRGCAIPSVKAITFHRDEPLINFKLAYDPAPEGIPSLVGNYSIHSVKPKETEFGVKVRVLLNKNGLVEFESANLNEDYYEEVIAAPTEKKEGEQKTEQATTEEKPAENKEQEVKKKKKTKSTPLKADVAYLYSLPLTQVNVFVQDEMTMNNSDRITLETYEKKNQVESYIYEMRNKLGDQYSKYVHQNVKDTFLAELEKAENWIYGDGAKTSKDNYIKKIDELKFFGNPIEKRYFEYNNLPEVAEKFLHTLKTFEKVVTSNEEQYAHITSEERKPVLEGITNNRKWLEDIVKKVQAANRAEEPPAKCADISNTQSNFINEYTKVINKPKPKPADPPKEEKKDNIVEEPAQKKEESQPEGEAPKKKDMDIES